LTKMASRRGFEPPTPGLGNRDPFIVVADN
jgi:hypothetical protein